MLVYHVMLCYVEWVYEMPLHISDSNMMIISIEVSINEIVKLMVLKMYIS